MAHDFDSRAGKDYTGLTGRSSHSAATMPNCFRQNFRLPRALPDCFRHHNPAAAIHAAALNDPSAGSVGRRAYMGESGCLMQRLGLLTGGGEAPGLNAVIRAAVKTACNNFNLDLIGIRDGFDGLLLGRTQQAAWLTPDVVRGLLSRGETILGAANRGNPFAHQASRDGQLVMEDISKQMTQGVRQLGLDGLIVIVGNGTLRIAQELIERFGLPIVTVPKTTGVKPSARGEELESCSGD